MKLKFSIAVGDALSTSIFKEKETVAHPMLISFRDPHIVFPAPKKQRYLLGILDILNLKIKVNEIIFGFPQFSS